MKAMLKAIVAGLVAGLAPVATALSSHTLDGGTIVNAIIFGLTAFGTVYFVPNTSPVAPAPPV